MRIKSVGPSRFVAEAWVRRILGYARNTRHNFHLENGTLYSFQTHMIATFVGNGENGDCIFLDNTLCNPTTTQHKKAVSQALRSWLPWGESKGYPLECRVFFVPLNKLKKPYADQAQMLLEKYYIPTLNSWILHGKRARTHRACRVEQAYVLLEQIKLFSEYFKLNPEPLFDKGLMQTLETMRVAITLSGDLGWNARRYYRAYSFVKVGAGWVGEIA
jgi:hypothetical protein